jgi:hypothetical protein
VADDVDQLAAGVLDREPLLLGDQFRRRPFPPGAPDRLRDEARRPDPLAEGLSGIGLLCHAVEVLFREAGIDMQEQVDEVAAQQRVAGAVDAVRLGGQQLVGGRREAAAGEDLRGPIRKAGTRGLACLTQPPAPDHGSGELLGNLQRFFLTLRRQRREPAHVALGHGDAEPVFDAVAQLRRPFDDEPAGNLAGHQGAHPGPRRRNDLGAADLERSGERHLAAAGRRVDLRGALGQGGAPARRRAAKSDGEDKEDRTKKAC